MPGAHAGANQGTGAQRYVSGTGITTAIFGTSPIFGSTSILTRLGKKILLTKYMEHMWESPREEVHGTTSLGQA